ncbi:hypothetical protein CPB86DRAFT_830208 [Serendipita vermifera]|nr:hypothetical protein CPB86DRAFT_830208 [Serendipita vermifera]
MSNTTDETHPTKTAPIDSIPDTILCLIFQHYVRMGRPVWDIIPVCKYWEQVALETCSLWSSILVQNRTLGDESIVEVIHNGDTEYYDRETGSKHICFEQSHLSKALSRAGGCFLDIEIRFRPSSLQEEFSLDFALDMLTNSAVCSRIESLGLTIFMTGFAGIQLDHFRNAYLPNLRQLKISSLPPEWLRNLLQSISATTKDLEVLECFSDEPLDQYLSDRILNRIHFLNLGGLEVPRQLDALVPKLNNVEEVACIPRNWPSDTTPQGAALHVRKVSVYCDPYHMRRLQWPNLEMLYVWEQGNSDAGTGSQTVNSEIFAQKLTYISFPMLKSFGMTTHAPLPWLSNVTAPRLEFVSIQWEDKPDRQLLKDLSFDPFPSITHLDLRTTRDDEETISLLKLMPNVSAVELSPTSMKLNFGLVLLRSLMDAESGLLCPKLSYLMLGFISHRVYTPKHRLEPEIKRLIQMEERAVSSLSVCVFWSDSDDFQMYENTVPDT